ncbi:hypothetical protein LCGC14_0784480 [marine sediment metagenome]|uniref:Uncharacterized protein n=1 Tax=marine sediment metagenome TaxID=412755 RepID=A0A0F9PYS6_9ZZZZ|nr:hypothetical protein [Phycisphaerae bacterium]
MSFARWHHHVPPAVVDQDDGKPTKSVLSKLKNDDLIAMATELGVELTGDEVKADLVEAILANHVDDVDEE